MMYDSLLSRSFSKQEKKKLGYGGLLICCVVFFTFCTVFKPFLAPFPLSNLQMSIESVHKLNIRNANATASSGYLNVSNTYEVRKTDTFKGNDSSTSPEFLHEKAEIEKKIKESMNDSSSSQPQFTGNNSNGEVKVRNTNATNHHQILANEICKKGERSDFCELKGDIRINGNRSTIFVLSSEQNNNSYTIRPYARKGDQGAMNNAREWSIKLHSDPPKCSHTHNIPAILFSIGGYAGNHFHAFTDIIFPLYSASRRFNGEVQFLVTNNNPWWISKFKTILNSLSNYQIINADEKTDAIHCFKTVTIGLPRFTRKELTVEPSEIRQNSMRDFRYLLRNSYLLKKTTAIKLKSKRQKRKPQLLIISRKRSRAFTNVDSIAQMAKRLGFRVVVYEPNGDMLKSAQVMNSCDVVLGVHGAGLTNMVFLPDNAILIQVVPFGGAEWVARTDFEEPSKDMNIRYIDYKIGINESSLVHQYPADHVVLRDPYSIGKKGWEAFKTIYFDKQNVSLDLDRFRPTLLKALELLHQ